MTYTVIVTDRGRPLVQHPDLDRATSREIVKVYRALGWPEEKVTVQPDLGEAAEARRAA
jgi:hypothetical protein